MLYHGEVVALQPIAISFEIAKRHAENRVSVVARVYARLTSRAA
jgi:hypothetical protein